MSAITREFTKEQLIEQAKISIERYSKAVVGFPRHLNVAMDLELARIALASLEAEPVGEVVLGEYDDCGCHPDARVACIAADGQADWGNFKDGTRLYTAPPAPASVPDDFDFSRLAFEKWITENYDSRIMRSGTGYAGRVLNQMWQCWLACRAAMLQGAEPVTTACKLPMQPLSIDAHGTLRFKENPIVRKLLDYATEHGYGLNEIALDEFEAEYQMQLAQLIGYSLSGYGTLSYVTDESYDRAAAAAPQHEVK